MNHRRVKGTVTGALLLAVSTLVWMGLSAAVLGASKGGSEKLTLDKSVAYALEGSPLIALAELSLKEAELAYTEARVDSEFTISRKALLAAQKSLEDVRSDLEAKKQEVAFLIRQAYYDVLLADATLNLYRESLAKASKQLQITKGRVSAGLASKVDLAVAENNEASARIALEGALADREQKLMQFNAALGRDLGAAVELAEKLAFEPINVKADESLSYALEHRRDLKDAEAVINLLQDELTAAQAEGTPSVEQERVKLALAKAEIGLRQKRDSVVLDVKASYSGLVQAQKLVGLAQRGVEVAGSTLKLVESKHQVGLATTMQLLEAQNAVSQAEVGVLKAIYNYNTAWGQFLRATGRPYGPLATGNKQQQ